MSTTDPLYIVAFDRRAFEAWCRSKGHDPESRAVRYVRNIDVLRPLRHDVRILFLDGWDARKDARKIYNRALVIQRRPR